MCVKIEKKVKKPTSKVIKAWKIINSQGTANTWEPLFRPGLFRRGEWARAKDPEYGFNCYKHKGFHGWNGTLIQVRVRFVEGYAARGTINEVIFAREIFVPKKKAQKKGK